MRAAVERAAAATKNGRESRQRPELDPTQSVLKEIITNTIQQRNLVERAPTDPVTDQVFSLTLGTAGAGKTEVTKQEIEVYQDAYGEQASLPSGSRKKLFHQLSARQKKISGP